MCSPFVRKEANRFYWMVKGQLIPECWKDEDVEKIYHSYMARLWHNEEAYQHTTGFHQAWLARQGKKISK